MLSALMSSLAAVYNSASTIIVNDMFKLYDPHISDTRSVRIGRIGATIFVGLSVAWLPMIENNDSELFVYTQQIISYVNAPLSVVYIFGHFWNRCNALGAYAALAVGFLLGIPRFVLTMLLDESVCGDNLFCTANYLLFAIFLFISCAVALIVTSLLTSRDISGWSILFRGEEFKSSTMI